MSGLPPAEVFYELNNMSSFALPDGTFTPVVLGDGSLLCQRALIVDNLLRASPGNPLTITGTFNVGSSFTFTIAGQALEPFWDGSVWVCS